MLKDITRTNENVATSIVFCILIFHVHLFQDKIIQKDICEKSKMFRV